MPNLPVILVLTVIFLFLLTLLSAHIKRHAWHFFGDERGEKKFETLSGRFPHLEDAG